MSPNTVVPLRQPDTIDDPLTAVLRSGARRLLAQAIEAEAEAFLAEMKGARLPDGRERLVRLGHPAALGAADPEPRCPAADPLPARGFDGRLPGGARGAAGEGRAEPVAVGGRAASGKRTTRAGSGATWRRGATSISGRTASTCRRGWS